MTFDEFFEEAERIGMTEDDLRRALESSRSQGCYPSLPVKIPEFGRTVNAVLRVIGSKTGKWSLLHHMLVAVDEPDCTWRFADDGTELAYHVDVIYWEYVDG